MDSLSSAAAAVEHSQRELSKLIRDMRIESGSEEVKEDDAFSDPFAVGRLARSSGGGSPSRGAAGSSPRASPRASSASPARLLAGVGASARTPHPGSSGGGVGAGAGAGVGAGAGASAGASAASGESSSPRLRGRGASGAGLGSSLGVDLGDHSFLADASEAIALSRRLEESESRAQLLEEELRAARGHRAAALRRVALLEQQGLRLRVLLTETMRQSEQYKHQFESSEASVASLGGAGGGEVVRLLRLTEPPPSFEAYRVDPVQASELEHTKARLRQSQHELDKLQARVEHLSQQKARAKQHRAAKLREAEQLLANKHAQLLGAVRRVHYLLEQNERQQAELAKKDSYVARLEAKLLELARGLNAARAERERGRERERERDWAHGAHEPQNDPAAGNAPLLGFGRSTGSKPTRLFLAPRPRSPPPPAAAGRAVQAAHAAHATVGAGPRAGVVLSPAPAPAAVVVATAAATARPAVSRSQPSAGHGHAACPAPRQGAEAQRARVADSAAIGDDDSELVELSSPDSPPGHAKARHGGGAAPAVSELLSDVSTPNELHDEWMERLGGSPL
jgi:hypothetical protein